MRTTANDSIGSVFGPTISWCGLGLWLLVSGCSGISGLAFGRARHAFVAGLPGSTRVPDRRARRTTYYAQRMHDSGVPGTARWRRTTSSGTRSTKRRMIGPLASTSRLHRTARNHRCHRETSRQPAELSSSNAEPSGAPAGNDACFE